MAVKKLALAVLVSGRGSNLKAILDACANDPAFPAAVSVVLSNRPDAPALEMAKAAQIPTLCIDHKDYSSREAFEQAMLDALSDFQIDLTVLAGFMRVLTPLFINHWHGRIINIHPSLLPDYKGLHTHARAIEDGKREAGCTIHYVVPEMDSGPIILQKHVPITPDDTPESLAARVLEQEHIAYPEAIKIIAGQYFKKK